MTFMLDEFDPSKVPAPQGPDVQPPHFLSAVAASISQTARDWNVNRQSQEELHSEKAQLVEEASKRLKLPSYDPGPQGKSIAFMGDDEMDAVLKQARDAAAADPEAWKDLDLTDEGIQARVTEMRKAEDQDESEIIAMSNHPLLAQLAGGVAASLIDIRQAPLLALGGSGTFLRVIGQEAALGAAGSAITLPSQFETAQELGKPAPDVATEIGMGAAGGAVIGGAGKVIAKTVGALGRGLEYYKGRSEIPKVPGLDPYHTNAAINAAEDALTNGKNPLQAVQNVLDKAPPPEVKPLPPLILDPSQRITQSVLPPMQGEPPRTVGEIQAIADRALQDAQTADSVLTDLQSADARANKPLIDFLKGGHRATKAGKAKGMTDGESLQIDPGGKLGQDLKAQGVDARTAPGLFKKGGREQLDNLVASEMEDRFPGITEATGTQYGDTYLNEQGVIDLIVRDANGDGSWLRSRADVMKAEADMGRMEATPAQDYMAMARAEDGLFVDLAEWQRNADFSGEDVDTLIARSFADWARDNWPEDRLNAQDKAEILKELQSRGGDANFLVEAAIDRKMGYAERPLTEAFEYGQYDPEGYAAYLDQASPDEVGREGASGAEGPEQGPLAAQGGAGRAGYDYGVQGDAQSIIPGTDQFDTGQSQRDRAAIAARQQQSRIGRLDQTRVEDDAGGLFGGAQSDLFSDPLSPKTQAHLDGMIQDIRADLEVNPEADFSIDGSLKADDGRALTSISDVLQEIEEADTLAKQIQLCRLGGANDAG